MENAYERIAQQVEKHKRAQTLMHYVNKQNLTEEHRQQHKGKATGIDRVGKEAYGENLEANIEDLLTRMKMFSYRPQAVRRTYIPKAGSDKMRPLGIPAYEDKLVQGAMRKVLDQVYEGKFYDFSYGFRKGKNCHQAIREVNQLIMTNKINFIVDADIKGFFDNVDHEWLMRFLEHDIADKNFAVHQAVSESRHHGGHEIPRKRQGYTPGWKMQSFAFSALCKVNKYAK